MSDFRNKILKQAMEHPSLVEEYGIEIAERLATDNLNKPSSQTPEGKKLRCCLSMRRTKLLQKLPKNAKLDLNNSQVAQIIFGKPQERKTRNDTGKHHKKRANNYPFSSSCL